MYMLKIKQSWLTLTYIQCYSDFMICDDDIFLKMDSVLCYYHNCAVSYLHDT